jgi:LacI family transcriptional regulator
MAAGSKNRYPRVAVCVDKARSYGRGVLRGIAEYVETFGPWSFYIDPQAAGTYNQEWLRDWRGDGVLVYVESLEIARRLRASRIPAVEVFGHRFDLRLPRVSNDDVAIGKLAAEHLLERKFQHFAFSGYPGEAWVARRQQGFESVIRQHGFDARIFRCSRNHKTLACFEQSQQELTRWVESLPKPAALMACSDRHAQRILDACRRADIAVPETMAVIGVDNDEETCRLSNPPLSSVMDDPRRIGYEAARLLDELMKKKSRPRGLPCISVPPLGIVTRRSTDFMAISDARVAEALRIIRQEGLQGLNVNTLWRRLGISRAAFYRRFQKAIGRTPHHEVLRVQLDRVETLLVQTEWTLEQIAEKAGFAHPEYMNVAFRRERGVSPGQFRRRRRAELEREGG